MVGRDTGDGTRCCMRLRDEDLAAVSILKPLHFSCECVLQEMNEWANWALAQDILIITMRLVTSVNLVMIAKLRGLLQRSGGEIFAHGPNYHLTNSLSISSMTYNNTLHLCATIRYGKH